MPETIIALANNVIDPETLTQIIKTVASAATPEALSATTAPFRKATIMGKKAARTPNTGIVYLGLSSVNDSQPFAIASDAVLQINAVGSTALDLMNFYLDVVTAGDGVIIWYS